MTQKIQVQDPDRVEVIHLSDLQNILPNKKIQHNCESILSWNRLKKKHLNDKEMIKYNNYGKNEKKWIMVFINDNKNRVSEK